MKKNSYLLGVIIGILAPLAGIYIFYLWKASATGFSDFLAFLFQNRSLLTAAISFALFGNAIAFTWAVNTRKDRTAKGIFIVTLLITIPLIIYKIFF